MTIALTKRIAGGMIGLMVGTLLALAAPLTYAQTTTVETTAAVTTPGAPTTGQGGDASANYALLGVSALALIAGGAYLARSRKEI